MVKKGVLIAFCVAVLLLSACGVSISNSEMESEEIDKYIQYLNTYCLENDCNMEITAEDFQVCANLTDNNTGEVISVAIYKNYKGEIQISVILFDIIYSQSDMLKVDDKRIHMAMKLLRCLHVDTITKEDIGKFLTDQNIIEYNKDDCLIEKELYDGHQSMVYTLKSTEVSPEQYKNGYELVEMLEIKTYAN